MTDNAPLEFFKWMLQNVGVAGTILFALCVYVGWAAPKVAVYVKESVDRLLTATEATAKAVTENSTHLAELRTQGAVEVAQHDRMELTLAQVKEGITTLVKQEHAA